MKAKFISVTLFLGAFLFGLVTIDHVSAQGVASAVSLFINGAYVSGANPLPVTQEP